MKNFLVIDDDALVRESIQLMLNDSDYKVDLAEDGVQGIKLFKQNKYDIVITDIIMPNKEGFETISELKSINDNVKIIAISGGSRNGIGAYLPIAENLGAKAILYKPFDESELIQTINAVYSH
ncbi:MAG: Response regulator MprA [Proteobacteria bacterium]|nr:MAG: Response regulator MprA [Pseudomonadota bacterium]|tara:strand:- start:974 stop:1342 length:369 start_codon:yes stop_codon:yes gene_type:complete